MNRFVFLSLLVASTLVGGCVTDRGANRIAALPAAVRAAPASYLVVTVRNEQGSGSASGASTPRGYDLAGPYRAGDAALRASRALARDYGLTEVAAWPIRLLGVHCLVYAIPPRAEAGVLVSRLQSDRRVESVEPLQAFAAEGERAATLPSGATTLSASAATRPTPAAAVAGYDDPYAGLQRNLATLGVLSAQRLTRGGGVRIAIIDTGGDTDHPDLRPHGLIGRNFVDADGADFRADVHGLAVAGVIGAVPNNGKGIVGIAPEAELHLYKACWRADGDGSRSVCNSFTLAQALSAAVESGDDIVNLSLAGPADPLLARIVARAEARGLIVVGALPRSGRREGFPAALPGVIAVGESEGASPGADVVLAPGQDIMSLAPGGRYDYYSGSSLAAAEVTGIIALLKSERHALDVAEAIRLLRSPAAGSLPDAGSLLADVARRRR